MKKCKKVSNTLVFSPIITFFLLNWNIKKQATLHRHSNKQIHKFWCFCFASMCSMHASPPAEWSWTNGVDRGKYRREHWTSRSGLASLIEITIMACHFKMILNLIPHSLMHKSLAECCKIHGKVWVKFEFNFLLQRAKKWLRMKSA